MKNIITIDVTLDGDKIPEKIEWKTATSKDTEVKLQKTKAFLLSLWDNEEKTALRLDLWTKDMRIDEMGDFFFQIFMTMADTFKRSHQNTALDKDIKEFAQQFYKNFMKEISSK